MARGYRFGVVGSISTVPDGSTVLPTDDIQIWLKCASIKDKAYTTLSQVLADSTTLSALISSNNAVDYMVRSTTWASGATADSGAMTLIGANNYASNTLLGNSTWLNAICNSNYFESVLNVKVPTMTSNTTPSGECFASSYQSGYQAYKSFDGNTTTYWAASTNATDNYVGYIFTTSVAIYHSTVTLKKRNGSIRTINLYLQGSADGTTWVDINSMEFTPQQINVLETVNIDSISGNNYSRYRLFVPEVLMASSNNFDIVEVQFYGRQDV